MKERVVGLIYRHDAYDYEIMLGTFDKKDCDNIERIVMTYENDLSSVRGDASLKLADGNIGYFERNEWNKTSKYRNTSDYEDVVELGDILNRYVQINGSVKGFEEYVESGFMNGNEVEYEEVTE